MTEPSPTIEDVAQYTGQYLKKTGGVITGDLTIDGALTITGANSGFEIPFLHVQDHKTSGTQGGTFTAGADRTRDLNTELTNTIVGAVVSGNKITLVDGIYFISASSPCFYAARHRVKWVDVTASPVDILVGTIQARERSSNIGSTDRSFVFGRFTVTDTADFELRHRCFTTRANDGMGIAVAWGETEIYSDVQIWRVS